LTNAASLLVIGVGLKLKFFGQYHGMLAAHINGGH